MPSGPINRAWKFSTMFAPANSSYLRGEKEKGRGEEKREGGKKCRNSYRGVVILHSNDEKVSTGLIQRSRLAGCRLKISRRAVSGGIHGTSAARARAYFSTRVGCSRPEADFSRRRPGEPFYPSDTGLRSGLARVIAPRRRTVSEFVKWLVANSGI